MVMLAGLGISRAAVVARWAKAAAPIQNLNALSLSPSTATQGQAATININGATAGSTITGSVPAGMTLNSAARTITGTPTGSGSLNFTLTETLAGYANSPRVNTLTLTVDEASGPVAPAGHVLLTDDDGAYLTDDDDAYLMEPV